VERIPARGEVRFINNIYFHQKLAEMPEKTKVRVAFDLCHAQSVWISDLQGRFICEAEWDGNKRAGFAESFRDQLKENRIQNRVKLAQEKIDLANAERGVIEGEVLQRVPALPSETVEPLKKVVVEAEFKQQESEEVKQLSYAETVRMLNAALKNKP